MEVRAVAKYIKVQPRKVRLIAAEVRGMPAELAAAKLRFHPSKGAFVLRKVLISAMANAVENNSLSADSLRISEIQVNEGPRMKRITQKAMGRGARIIKKTSHITVVVEDFEGKGAVKPHGTKSKPRPKFEAPKGGKKKAAKAQEPAAEAVEAVAEETPAVEEAPVAQEDSETMAAQAEAESPAEETPAVNTTSEEPAEPSAEAPADETPAEPAGEEEKKD